MHKTVKNSFFFSR